MRDLSLLDSVKETPYRAKELYEWHINHNQSSEINLFFVTYQNCTVISNSLWYRNVLHIVLSFELDSFKN